MKPITALFPLALLLAANSAYALSFPEGKVKQNEQKSLEITQRYAERSGKPMPDIQDYRYGMPLNIAKVVHQSPRIEYCGVVPKLMVFEDTSGELRSIRYRGQGECRGQN
ncbi:conserved exported hypothetical protein [Pseudomonas sp. 8Z]|uniref:DUF2790 domain-containing protein n=1 Tax=Pseudomonas sp. 8Z TaxID=2653166 RepID=UPI0012F38954|nr:DUF2790 domain-containing protein [Pseudomonas sp. 8Z]VXC47488.1 conserved exported hypothetical protein [Pseudomonas sp. 8Z]